MALRREEWEVARRFLLEAAEENPTDAAALAYLSGALLALGQVEEARTAVERALALEPDGFAPRLKAGELALRLGDLEAAESHCLAAVRAAEPGSGGEAAARATLASIRRLTRRAIDHRAALPDWSAGLSSVRGVVAWLGRGGARRPGVPIRTVKEERIA